ncbi:MAG: thioredoxin family protein, partial [Armatimonadetes bacterium]|nr:thioredoxin family protein [Armatimonadota bacterium]
STPTYQSLTNSATLGSGNQSAPAPSQPAGTEVTPNGAGSVNGSFTERANRLAGKLLKGGNLLPILPVLFLVGLLLNLTPCVYPLIPITIGYFGGQAASNPGAKTIKLAVAYVIGMVVMYAGLGLFSSLAGAVFGSWLELPWVLAIFAAVMFALGLAMFERKNGQPIWEIRLPSSLTDKAQARSGLGGALLMGLLVGVVAAPCIGPAVVALINVVAIRHSVPFGLVTFGALGLGLGVPYLVLGSSASLLAKLPRSGEWMMAIKHIFGLILFGVGIYYLNGIIQNETAYRWLMAGYVALAGIYLNLWDVSGETARRFFQFKRALGLVVVAFAVWMMVPPPPPSLDVSQIAWQPYSQAGVESAESQGKPVLIDFGAKWCAECNEMDQKTYANPAVVQAAAGIITLKVNATNSNDPKVQAAEKRYGIVGLPAVIFIGRNGHERTDLRLMGFEPPSLFVKRLERLKG